MTPLLVPKHVCTSCSREKDALFCSWWWRGDNAIDGRYIFGYWFNLITSAAYKMAWLWDLHFLRTRYLDTIQPCKFLWKTIKIVRKRQITWKIFFKIQLFYYSDYRDSCSREKNPTCYYLRWFKWLWGCFYGHKQALTPNIDKLDASGIRFVSHKPMFRFVNLPESSLFTGVYPHDSKDFGWTDHTKPKLFKEQQNHQWSIFKRNG
jgi:hypothetical protein